MIILLPGTRAARRCPITAGSPGDPGRTTGVLQPFPGHAQGLPGRPEQHLPGRGELDTAAAPDQQRRAGLPL
jgi:hypothetical protein